MSAELHGESFSDEPIKAKWSMDSFERPKGGAAPRRGFDDLPSAPGFHVRLSSAFRLVSPHLIPTRTTMSIQCSSCLSAISPPGSAT
jgi:hypothetical protein